MRRRRLTTGCLILTIVLSATLFVGIANAWVYDHYSYDNWAPYSGYLQVNGTAYTDLTWGPRSGYFFYDPNQNGYDPNQNGYDHEIWFYDYCDPTGGCAYSRSAYNWSTNLPGYHDLDNNYSNPSGEVGIELDTFHADLIQPYTWYYVDFNLDPGSDWSLVKFRAARTAEGTDCNAWWCATEWDGQIIVPYGPYRAPGASYYWTNY